MKAKFIAIAALAATTLLASCNKDNEGTDLGNGETRTVKLAITSGPDTRAVGPHVGNDAIVLSTGTLYFATAGGTIVKKVDVIAGSSAYSDVAGTVGVGVIGATQIINVPATAVTLHMAGNSQATLPTVVLGTTNISAVKDLVQTVANQYDATLKGVAMVALYGEGAIVLDGAGPDYKSVFNVTPIAARFEVGKITAAGTITSYTVEGVFLNNYYSQQKFAGGIINAADLFAPSQVAADYVGNHATTYTAALNGMVYDYAAAGIGTLATMTYNPGAAGEVWGYNVVVPTVGCAVPHIVVRIKDVVINGTDNTTYAGTWFLTIANFYNSGTSTPITFTKGNVYRIADLQFDQDDLTVNPEMSSKTVNVAITMISWISQDVDYDFN